MNARKQFKYLIQLREIKEAITDDWIAAGKPTRGDVYTCLMNAENIVAGYEGMMHVKPSGRLTHALDASA